MKYNMMWYALKEYLLDIKEDSKELSLDEVISEMNRLEIYENKESNKSLFDVKNIT